MPPRWVPSVTRLQARNLVRRESDPGDRRRKLLWLTPEGETLAQQLAGPAQRVQERLMAPLPPHEQALLKQLLARLAATPAKADGRIPPRLAAPDWPAPVQVHALCTARAGGHSRAP